MSNIPDNAFVHESSYIDDNVIIGSETKIWHFSHILSNCIIGTSCSLGQNVVVGPNVNIENGAIVGASAVVMKNVKTMEIVAGNPAKYVKRRIIEK